VGNMSMTAKNGKNKFRPLPNVVQRMKVKNAVNAANAANAANKSGTSLPPLPTLQKYHNTIQPLFKINNVADEATYNTIMSANLNDPRIRIAIENKFYEAKQLEYNLTNDISKL
jgi:hypothetical protein